LAFAPSVEKEKLPMNMTKNNGASFASSTVVAVVVATLLVCASTASASTYSIPANKVDAQKIFWGSTTGFDKAAEIDFEAIVKATPEYKEIKKKKLEQGTAKYWILFSQASDRAVRAVSEIGEESTYDLVAAAGYLGSLEPAIPADDITKAVIKHMNDAKK
jgi:Skp family chaperone for outer membrane proteins